MGRDLVTTHNDDLECWVKGCTAPWGQDGFCFEHDPSNRANWGWPDYATEALCRAVGCRSVIKPWQGWGYRLVCNPLHLWLFRREARKEARRG